jgi:hypothetical protein
MGKDWMLSLRVLSIKQLDHKGMRKEVQPDPREFRVNAPVQVNCDKLNVTQKEVLVTNFPKDRVCLPILSNIVFWAAPEPFTSPYTPEVPILQKD